MPHTYRVVVKGNTTQAIYAAQTRGFAIVGIIQNGKPDSSGNTRNTILGVEHTSERAIVDWFSDGASHPPFPPGDLLYYFGKDGGSKDDRHLLDFDVEEDAPKVWMMKDDLEGLSEPHQIPLAEYDVGEAVVTVWKTHYYKYRVELTQLRNGRAVVVLSEASTEHTPEDAARWLLLKAQQQGYVTGLAIERLRDATRVSRRNPGWHMDDDLDGFQGFDGSEPHPFSVSTLVPGLRGKPLYRYFDSFKDALIYARGRARAGKKLREGGKAYFIMSQDSETPAYRVFRGNLGAEQAPGAKHYTEKREFVLVQKAEGKIKGYPDRTHWVMDKASSVEILNAEIEKSRKQRLRPEPKHVRISKETRAKHGGK